MREAKPRKGQEMERAEQLRAGTGRRRAATELVAEQPRQSLADVGSHELCFKQENNLMVRPRGTHCPGSLKTQKEQGRDENAHTINAGLMLQMENWNKSISK